jgi:hypothetical protein
LCCMSSRTRNEEGTYTPCGPAITTVISGNEEGTFTRCKPTYYHLSSRTRNEEGTYAPCITRNACCISFLTAFEMTWREDESVNKLHVIPNEERGGNIYAMYHPSCLCSLKLLYLKYLAAKSIKYGQLGASVWPPLCWRKAISPLVNVVSTGGNSVVPKSFLPNSLYTGPAAAAAINMPLGSTQPSPFWPLLMNTGRGAQSATSSCASTGRSFQCNGPAYLIKLPAIQ